MAALITVAIIFASSTVYFFILGKMNSGSGLWWAIAIIGIFAVAIL